MHISRDPGLAENLPRIDAAPSHRTTIRRLAGNPIIGPQMLPGLDGANINGPSVIAAPEWLPNRLGRFYLYFAHHHGAYIRLAVADRLEGPWRLHTEGTLQLRDAPACRGHIASPDVHVDNERREIRMYFHGSARTQNGQKSFLALSRDGLRFTANATPLGPFYFRVVQFRGRFVALAKGGELFVSADGVSGFQRATQQPFTMRSLDGNAPGDLRHVAAEPREGGIDVYFTRIGDAPESILRAHIAPVDETLSVWRAGPFEVILKPEQAWEGATLPLRPSRPGATGPENAVRDPAVLVSDGRRYLIYSVAGESGIAISEMLESR